MGREARANEQTSTETAPFLITIPIAKVDKAKRLVTGPATCEVLDKQGEIVDYTTAKAFFLDPDLWPGNIREMHEPKAVGKKFSVECDDDNKVINLTARVSTGAPDTWEKVLDGTLSMYSIGGSGKRVAEKTVDGKNVKRLFLEQLAEVSLVDNGANPLAKFTIVKSVDGVITDAEPAELLEAESVLHASTVRDITSAADVLAKATGALDAAIEASRPAYVAGGIRALLAALATMPDRTSQKASIVAKASVLGAPALDELPLAWKAAAVVKGGPEYYDIDQALAAISLLERLVSTEYYDVRYGTPTGATPDPIKVSQVAMLKSAIDAVLQFLISEHQAQFAADPNDTNHVPIVSDSAVVAMFVKSLDVVTKAGARHSKGDMAMVQKVHDLSGDLGAACKDMGDDEDVESSTRATDVSKAAPALIPATATDEDPTMHADIAKLSTALTESQATVAKQAEVVAKQAETIAAFESRLTLIENGPAAGGPVRSAEASKALGGPGQGEQTGDAAAAAAIVKAMQQIAESSDNPEMRAVAAKEIIKFQTRTGGNALSFVSPPQ